MRVLSFDIGLRHLAYAELNVVVGSDARIERWGVIDVTRGAKLSPDALTTALVEAIDAEFFDPGRLRYDVVLIENQPSRKNPAMKAVQVAIHAYFATIRLHTGCVGEVRPVSASQKLCTMLATDLGLPPPEAGDKEQRTPGAAYRARKARSVELCRHVLATAVERDGRAEATLRDAKKKDDLSDALLQALWYVRCFLPTARPKAESTSA